MEKQVRDKKAIILMAVYNGGRFIATQVESILNQSFTNWEMIVSDDGSTDDTLKILDEYKKFDNRIIEILHRNTSVGAYRNFFYLINHIKDRSEGRYEYYFFCDQDDIWELDKMQSEIEMIEKENHKIPMLCYSDAFLIDDRNQIFGTLKNSADLKLINQKDFIYEYKYMIGTSMCFNKELWSLIKVDDTIPNDMPHDQYIRKFAVTYGKIVYIDKPLLKYRRHDSNVSTFPIRDTLFDAVTGLLAKRLIFVRHCAEQHNRNLYYASMCGEKTEFITDLENAILSGGISALSFIKKYNIRVSTHKYRRLAFDFVFVFRLYKKYM